MQHRRGGKLKLASKPSHVKGLQAMYEEIRREADPSVEWLSRQDLRKELGSDAFHGAILSSEVRDDAWAAMPTVWPRPPIVMVLRSGSTIPSLPASGYRTAGD